MPLHVAPPIRFLEEVRESAGIQAPQDSVATTYLKANEAVSAKAKVLPSQMKVIQFGTTYIPS